VTIHEKNYRKARRRIYSYCYHDNGERLRRNKYTTNFDAWTQESEVNLPLIGLRLRKYIELSRWEL